MFLRRSGLVAGGLATLGTLPLTSMRKAEGGHPPRVGAQVTVRKSICTFCSVGCTVVAEVANGEGKTLVAALPTYLNALQGKGVHVTTVNDYLARRDAEWMGPIYRTLGLSVGVLQMQMPEQERAEAYRSDITYGTASEFGFSSFGSGAAAAAGGAAVGSGVGFSSFGSPAAPTGALTGALNGEAFAGEGGASERGASSLG